MEGLIMRMHTPPHPGEILKEMWLKPLKLSCTKAAESLNVSRKTLSEILNTKASVTSEMALRLELAFGKSAESWLGHQAAYDLWQLENKRDALGVHKISELGSQNG